MAVVGRTLWRIIRLAGIVVIGTATMVGVLAGMGSVASQVSTSASSVAQPVRLPTLGGISYLYDRNGNQLQSFNRKIQTPVPLSSVSTQVIESVLAVEDSDFYRHGAVDARSILRAAQANVTDGQISQGGSTISQQVVKQSVVGTKKNLQRKLHEARVATKLEEQYTKNEILSYYLNMVYLGNNIYGVQAAAKTYWGTDASKLNWSQGAMIAALIRNPNGYDPIHHPSAARRQRAIALQRLVATGRLSKQDAAKADHDALPTSLTKTVPPKDYFVEEVRRRLLNKNGAYDDTQLGTALGDTPEKRAAELYGGGLRIYTTYDPNMEQQAVQARQSTVPGIGADGRIPRTAPDGSPRWATETITSVEPSTGAVRVLLGGPSYSADSQVDYATTSSTNPGSTFKSFVLAALFEHGFVPDDIVDGTSPCVLSPDDPNFIDPTRKVALPGYGPKSYHNFDGEGGSVGTIRTQTLQSSNCGFARLGQIVGLRNVIDMAKAMGVSNSVWNAPDPLASHPNTLNPYSVQLAYGGAIGVSALDLASAYATFANEGVYNAPYFVDRITDENGKVIWAHRLIPKRAMSTQSARLVNQVLLDNVRGGTATAANLASGQPAAGKTGTSDGPTDLWFAGYTPQLSTAVWIGSGANPFVVFPGGTGGAYSARTWRAFMSMALDGQPIVPFAAPEPTRRGITIAIGPGDAMTAEKRYERNILAAQQSEAATNAQDPASSPESPSSTTTLPSNIGPPVTAYAP